MTTIAFFQVCIVLIFLNRIPTVDFNQTQVFTWFVDEFVNITYYLSLTYLPYQANGYSSLAHVSVILWPASLLMSYVGSSDKFRAIVCGLAIRPLMPARYPHCQLPRPPISLLSTEETKSAPGNIFFQSIKSRILCGIISYCALMAPS